MIQSEIIVAVLALLGTLVGSITGILTANKLTNFRIAELEKKVEKHNGVIERVAVVERDIKTAFRCIDEIKEEVNHV